MYKSIPLFESSKVWFTIFGRSAREDYLEVSRINFQKEWLNQILQSMQRPFVRSTALQLSCKTTCFNSWNKTIRSHLLLWKVIIFIVDKVERYDGQNKHQGRLRLPTMISLVHAILESWVTVPEIVAESDQVHVFN